MAYERFPYDECWLSEDRQVFYDEDTPHKNIFNLYWDSDVVALTRKDAEALIPLLNKWLQGF